MIFFKNEKFMCKKLIDKILKKMYYRFTPSTIS